MPLANSELRVKKLLPLLEGHLVHAHSQTKSTIRYGVVFPSDLLELGRMRALISRTSPLTGIPACWSNSDTEALHIFQNWSEEELLKHRTELDPAVYEFTVMDEYEEYVELAKKEIK